MTQATQKQITPTDKQQKRELLIGVGCGLLNSIFLVISSSMVKLATSEQHNAVDVFFYRSIGVLILSVILLSYTRQWSSLKTTNHKKQIIRAVLGSITMLLAFMSYDHLPIAQAQLFFFMSPLIVVLLSYPLLGERVGIYRAGAVCIGLFGASIVLQPGTLDSTQGALIGLGVTLFYASVTLCLRWMGKTENANITVFYFAAVSTLMVLPFIYFYANVPSLYTGALIIGISVLSFGIQMCLTYSYKLAPAAIISPLIYTNLIWALTIDFVIWSKTPTTNMMIGAFIIIFSNLFILWREQKKNKKMVMSS